MVVIPLHNKAHTVLGTIESVLEQTFQKFEIVVVDDGSTDGGAEKIARRFSDSRIRIITQEHHGTGAARNKGVEGSTYDLIAFLDADDLWLPGYLLTMKRAIDEHPGAGMYCCGGVIRYADGSGYIRSLPRFPESPHEVDYFSNPQYFANCSSIVVRKADFTSAGGFPENCDYGEDTFLFYKLALARRVVSCPAALTIYEKDVEGQITAGDPMRSYVASIERSSIVYELWASSPEENRNPSFIRFTKRDLRRSMLEFIRERDEELVRNFFGGTDERLLARFTAVEKLMYKNPRLRIPAVAWIYGCELAWRFRRPPRLKYSRDLNRSLGKPLPASRREVGPPCEELSVNGPCEPSPTEHN